VSCHKTSFHFLQWGGGGGGGVIVLTYGQLATLDMAYTISQQDSSKNINKSTMELIFLTSFLFGAPFKPSYFCSCNIVKYRLDDETGQLKDRVPNDKQTDSMNDD
jgi:hypothetical protein